MSATDDVEDESGPRPLGGSKTESGDESGPRPLGGVKAESGDESDADSGSDRVQDMGPSEAVETAMSGESGESDDESGDGSDGGSSLGGWLVLGVVAVVYVLVGAGDKSNSGRYA